METIPFSYAYAYAYVTPGLHSLCLCLCLCLCRSVNQALQPCQTTRLSLPLANPYTVIHNLDSRSTLLLVTPKR